MNENKAERNEIEQNKTVQDKTEQIALMKWNLSLQPTRASH